MFLSNGMNAASAVVRRKERKLRNTVCARERTPMSGERRRAAGGGRPKVTISKIAQLNLIGNAVVRAVVSGRPRARLSTSQQLTRATRNRQAPAKEIQQLRLFDGNAVVIEALRKARRIAQHENNDPWRRSARGASTQKKRIL